MPRLPTIWLPSHTYKLKSCFLPRMIKKNTVGVFPWKQPSQITMAKKKKVLLYSGLSL